MSYTFTNSKGRTYWLKHRLIEQNNGQHLDWYYFSPTSLGHTKNCDELPKGYKVKEQRDGFPVLRKKH